MKKIINILSAMLVILSTGIACAGIAITNKCNEMITVSALRNRRIVAHKMGANKYCTMDETPNHISVRVQGADISFKPKSGCIYIASCGSNGPRITRVNRVNSN
ncbi:hypothetical protein HOL34_02935 [bacterium]|jgi:hypothetical protein|nr:hypothetical protein [bacterium]MBT3903415.1 hypothetical protein [bacterium]MBT4577806.1 hypothetical protein [bacterium]MBT5345770.1 hypothetical protein [bacterium]MBT6130889.1 hypothetical protein [bacterium]